MPGLRYLLSTVCLLMINNGWAQFELPNTDIWLLQISNQQIIKTAPVVQTDGYDNQPSFSQDGRWLYYTHGELSDDGLGYTDIWRADIATGHSSQITDTAISEFSPLPLPNSLGISMVRVQTDGRQELWSSFPDTEQPERRIVNAEPVGYHAWLNADSLALFVLGNADLNETNRLEIWKPSTNSGKRITDNIGRGLQVNQQGELFYLQNPSKIMRLSSNQRSTSVIDLYENSQDFSIAPDGGFWHGTGSKIYRYSQGDQHWQLITDLQQYDLSGITRMAVSPDGNLLAVVVNQ